MDPFRSLTPNANGLPKVCKTSSFGLGRRGPVVAHSPKNCVVRRPAVNRSLSTIINRCGVATEQRGAWNRPSATGYQKETKKLTPMLIETETVVSPDTAMGTAWKTTPDSELQKRKLKHRGPRARIACRQCRKRKVRCDIEPRGAPCTNCRLDAVDCVMCDRKK